MESYAVRRIARSRNCTRLLHRGKLNVSPRQATVVLITPSLQILGPEVVARLRG